MIYVKSKPGPVAAANRQYAMGRRPPLAPERDGFASLVMSVWNNITHVANVKMC